MISLVRFLCSDFYRNLGYTPELKNQGYEVSKEDLEHISPAPFEHFIRLGKYNFKDESSWKRMG